MPGSAAALMRRSLEGTGRAGGGSRPASPTRPLCSAVLFYLFSVVLLLVFSSLCPAGRKVMVLSSS